MRYHRDQNGRRPYTVEEEEAADAREAAWVADEPNRLRLAARKPDAMAILESDGFRNMVKAGREKTTADAWVAAQANPADALSKILRGLSMFIRYQMAQNNNFFESDE